MSSILMHNKALQTQYLNNFDNFNNFIDLRGAGNYHCKIVNDTAENCILKGHIRKAKQHMPPQCNFCEYRLSRINMHKTDYVITNYSYFLSIALNSKKGFGDQLLTIFDQSHMFNDVFCNHNKINLTTQMLKNLTTILSNYLIVQDQSEHYLQNLKALMKFLDGGKLNQNNYMDYLGKVYRIITDMCDTYLHEASNIYQSGDIQTYKKYMKIHNRLNNMINKYGILFDYNYEHTVNIEKGFIEIQPIFVKDLFNLKMTGGKYVLLMSATNQPQFMGQTLSIDKDQIAFIKSPPVFKPQNKKIAFLNIQSLNYRNLQDYKTIEKIGDVVNAIIEQHKGQKGVIISPSFKLAEQVYKQLKRKKKSVKIMKHHQGQPLQLILEQFKDYKKPSVLISPSL